MAAGTLAGAMIFGVGFALGVPRTLLVEPALGPWPALLIELPLMLFASYLVVRWLIGSRRVPTGPPRLVFAIVAFCLLMLAELLFAMALRGWSGASFFQKFTTPIGFVGLLGQIAFALMPLFVKRNDAA
jgi:phosphoglycerol transferase MdoB-like AlkP superfamily enzyme